ncbi:hypothetical protein [Crossiella sp. CA198]|uniref:hypothetical protein n=1 Tax=Crossiella sp. CA198 TaxID=3455607 RepID=UPI003F8D7966
MTWDGTDYQRRFDHLAATGADLHGKADFVRSYWPGSVLDAGCGTRRVAIDSPGTTSTSSGSTWSPPCST